MSQEQLEALLDKPADELTAEEWQALKAYGAGAPETDFEQWAESAGIEWDALGEAIARVLRG
ncbi:hypothetical protein [Leptolyngbya sp. FACHB-16]|uniref:hypothetical protein n=1 Tax=unclassified Leptolyngbya TaxID=2650499 RepID=UPI0016875679|nr:hypothetical protein [Leptolyngbya sp. FACHB-16]MBD2153153.1 hypothetical protein [Leptolyngbya sp. FACHB-16]